MVLNAQHAAHLTWKMDKLHHLFYVDNQELICYFLLKIRERKIESGSAEG